ncbi:hypothetical protein IPH92_03840 [Candidatus Kaiserbacteria bacterium]|nr:MAG: hypothetical protein IPH92_03840 [Candidatus Kaiserbacteria bacterium]
MTDTNEMRATENINVSHHKHLGPILGALILTLILILGGLSLWGSKLNQEAVIEIDIPVNNEPETPRAAADQAILETVSTSDELSAIEADLGSSNLEALDTDLTTIDAELNASLEIPVVERF